MVWVVLSWKGLEKLSPFRTEARGTGGGGRRGARERERRAAERAEAGDSGAERGEGTGQRETASPMVLHCGILWESR